MPLDEQGCAAAWMGLVELPANLTKPRQFIIIIVFITTGKQAGKTPQKGDLLPQQQAGKGLASPVCSALLCEGDSVGSTVVLCEVALWRKTAGKISCGEMRPWSGPSGFTPSSEVCVGWILHPLMWCWTTGKPWELGGCW